MDNDDNCLQQNSWDALLKDIVLEENDEDVSDDEDLGNVGIEQNDLSKGSKNEMEEPIYEGHSMPCYVSTLLVLTYAITHTGIRFSDLLVLLSLHWLAQPKHLKSVYALKKYFSSIQNPLIIHKYCSFCFLSLYWQYRSSGDYDKESPRGNQPINAF